MSERLTIWWVGKTTDKGVNLVRKMFYDEKEAIEYAEKYGLEPPKKYVAQDFIEEVALHERIHSQEENIKHMKATLGILKKDREDLAKKKKGK